MKIKKKLLLRCNLNCANLKHAALWLWCIYITETFFFNPPKGNYINCISLQFCFCFCNLTVLCYFLHSGSWGSKSYFSSWHSILSDESLISTLTSSSWWLVRSYPSFCFYMLLDFKTFAFLLYIRIIHVQYKTLDISEMCGLESKSPS